MFSINLEDHERAPNHYFYNLGLWDKDMTNDKGWKLATLQTIINMLGHENVSISEARYAKFSGNSYKNALEFAY